MMKQSITSFFPLLSGREDARRLCRAPSLQLKDKGICNNMLQPAKLFHHSWSKALLGRRVWCFIHFIIVASTIWANSTHELDDPLTISSTQFSYAIYRAIGLITDIDYLLLMGAFNRSRFMPSSRLTKRFRTKSVAPNSNNWWMTWFFFSLMDSPWHPNQKTP